MTKQEIIETLNLTFHPTEGGYYRRTYESARLTETDGKTRFMATSIYYMLTDDSPHGFLHRNKSDIIHCHHGGSVIRYTVISPQGEVSRHLLGPHLDKGETPQLVVRGGDWKCSELTGGEYGLISEVVVPGFEYEDNEIASFEQAVQLAPELIGEMERFIKKPDTGVE